MALRPQLLTIGNTYMGVKSACMDAFKLSEAAQLSQKAIHWRLPGTDHVASLVSMVPNIPSSLQPSTSNFNRVIVPSKVGTSKTFNILEDLKKDSFAMQRLLGKVDPARPVVVEPWMYTPDVQRFEGLLSGLGLNVLHRHDRLHHVVSKFGSKFEFHKMLVEGGLGHLRPRTWIVSDTVSGTLSAADFERIPAGHYYLKGARGAGGATVCKLHIPLAWDCTYVQSQLNAGKQPGTPIKAKANPCDWEGPFLVEADAHMQGLPRAGTVDARIGPHGLAGRPTYSEMYILDEKNYAGFFHTPIALIEKAPWYPTMQDYLAQIAKLLSAEGYRGMMNIDFQYASDRKDVVIIEMNNRRSALTDGTDVLAAELPGSSNFALGLDYATFSDETLEQIQQQATSSLNVYQLTGMESCTYRSFLFTSEVRVDIDLVRARL